jgi:DNA processing protein
LDAVSVAIVGSRLPTPYGRAVAERLAGDLARAGVTVTSGLARGIDTAAHQGALGNKGRTVGVLGSGLDQFYPKENKRLADRMALQGAVMTEFPMTTPPDQPNFPRRNRLIAALSVATVVVEARERSGALITARLAAELGREVYAVPGAVFSPLSKGPHRLLKDGARLLESVEDLLELEPFKSLIAPRTPAAPAERTVLNDAEQRVWRHVNLDPVGVDGLAVKAGLPPAAVSSTLLNLELKGLVRLMPGKTYVRTDKGLRGN